MYSQLPKQSVSKNAPLRLNSNSEAPCSVLLYYHPDYVCACVCVCSGSVPFHYSGMTLYDGVRVMPAVLRLTTQYESQIRTEQSG